MCFEAAKTLEIPSLREASVEDIESKKELLMTNNPTMYKRFRHVVSEIARTQEAAKALEAQDYTTFGRLMVESHNSLR